MNLLQSRNRVLDVRKNMVTRGNGGKISWKIRIDIYTLLYIKQITNKDLLYSTGNSTQYFIMAYMGKNLEKKSRYMYMYN